jgi:hypothetical protein
MKRIFYLVFTLIYCVFCEEPQKEMKIDVQVNGELDMEDEMSYYVLKIPKKIEKNKYNLVLRIKETDSADLGQDDFSDPDIYVSKVDNFIYNIKTF